MINMKNKKNIFIFILAACLMISSAMLFLNKNDNNKSSTVFMENVKVFENFEMKKDYDKMIENEMTPQQKALDSLGLVLESYSKSGSRDSMSIFKVRKEYYVSQKLFEKKFNELSQKYTNEVYTRLNEYIKAYGKEKKYDLILGSTGQGNVMFVSEAHDITEDLIKYINQKYKN